jgi:hypothetical protein
MFDTGTFCLIHEPPIACNHMETHKGIDKMAQTSQTLRCGKTNRCLSVHASPSSQHPGNPSLDNFRHSIINSPPADYTKSLPNPTMSNKPPLEEDLTAPRLSISVDPMITKSDPKHKNSRALSATPAPANKVDVQDAQETDIGAASHVQMVRRSILN